MNESLQPDGIAPPAAHYALGMRVPAESELLFTAGIVGTRADGSIAPAVGEQADEIWRSIATLLASAGFTHDDVVSYTTYLVVGQDPEEVMAARDRFFEGHRAASTLVTVPALARPEWKVEIAVTAAKREP
ncbi:MAG: RidA family protein [Actinomycetota bacterium]